MTIVPAPKQPQLHHLFGLLDCERFTLPGRADFREVVYRVEHASTGDGDPPVYVHESTEGLVPAQVIFRLNGGSYFVMPILAGKDGGS